MDQIKRLGRDLSLRKSLVIYAAVFVVLAIVLSNATAFLCYTAARSVRDSYADTVEKYYLTNENGERLGKSTYVYKEAARMTKQDECLLTFLDVFPMIATPIYSAVCIVAAAFLFYRKRLREPLAKLRDASEKISRRDLDFSIAYDRKDELGQLCASFETMRSALAENFSEMWRQVEERKQLNAAFAHDLRTPLTVLKGYDEVLQAGGDPQTRETAVTMGKHISRMEAYVESMSRLQRLEDAQPEYKTVPLQPLLSALSESAEILCGKSGKVLCLQNDVPDMQASIDADFVTQVSNNLMANAARYARHAVTLSFALRDDGLELSVSDDGKGFDSNSLCKAAEPYFTMEADRSEHFGLGLYICRLLCERHGGTLEVANGSVGAKVTALFKFFPL